MEGVREITRHGAKFIDGQEKEFDSIILATGYKSNVPCWLKVFVLIPFSKKQFYVDGFICIHYTYLLCPKPFNTYAVLVVVPYTRGAY